MIELPKRSFVKGLVGFSVGAIVAPTIFIPRFVNAAPVGEKFLSFYNTHTGEFLNKCVFWENGVYIKENQLEINRLFRDFRTGDVKEIDIKLIDLIYRLYQDTGSSEKIHLISGYRSPKTNASLRRKSKGVAYNSQHKFGKAADIMIPGRSLRKMKDMAKKYSGGGVGLYKRFLHLDTGPVRSW